MENFINHGLLLLTVIFTSCGMRSNSLEMKSKTVNKLNIKHDKAHTIGLVYQFFYFKDGYIDYGFTKG